MDMVSIATIIGASATVIGTIASIVSASVAVKAKNETKKIVEKFKEENSRNIKSSGNVTIKNTGENNGILTGINSGEIKNVK